MSNAVEVHSDDHLRLVGRLSAIETLLVQSLMDRAAVDQDPYAWIKQYVLQLRQRRGSRFTGVPVDLQSRLEAATAQAVTELVDVIEQHGEIFRPTTSRQ